MLAVVAQLSFLLALWEEKPLAYPAFLHAKLVLMKLTASHVFKAICYQEDLAVLLVQLAITSTPLQLLALLAV